MVLYDVIGKNKEIKTLEEKYLKLCNDKRDAEEELMEVKFKLTQNINKLNAELGTIKVELGRVRREFHLNKVDAAKVERLRKQFARKKESLKKELIQKFGKKCHYCSKTDSLDIHHLTPLSHGGDNSIENLVFTCQDCHEGLH